MKNIETKKVASASAAVEIISRLNYRNDTFIYDASTFSNDYTIECRHFDAYKENGDMDGFGMIEIVVNGKLEVVRFFNHFRDITVDLKLGDFTPDYSKVDNVIDADAEIETATEPDVEDYAVSLEAQDGAVEDEYRAAHAAERARIEAKREAQARELFEKNMAQGNYTLKINGEHVTFQNHSIVKITAPKFGFGYSTQTGKGKFYSLKRGLIYRPAAKKRIFDRYNDLELAATQIADAENFFNAYGDGKNSEDFFKVAVNIKLADGTAHSYRRYFDYFNQARDFANAAIEKFTGNNNFFLAIDRNNISKNYRYIQCDQDGYDVIEVPDTAYYAGMPASEIQNLIDELDRAIADNEKFAEENKALVWEILVDANFDLRQTKSFLEFVLHESENSHAEIETANVEDYAVSTDAQDVATDAEIANAKANDIMQKFLAAKKEVGYKRTALGARIWYITHTRYDADGNGATIASKSTIAETNAYLVKNHGLTILQFLDAQEAWIDARIAEGAAQMAIEDQAAHISDKIARDRKNYDDSEIWELLPETDELNDIPERYKAPCDICHILSNKLNKATLPYRFAEYMGVTLQNGVKIITDFTMTYVGWNGYKRGGKFVDKYIFVTCNMPDLENPLASYDTPAQVSEVINQIAATIARGETKFTFPAIEELASVITFKPAPAIEQTSESDDFTAKLAELKAEYDRASKLHKEKREALRKAQEEYDRATAYYLDAEWKVRNFKAAHDGLTLDTVIDICKTLDKLNDNAPEGWSVEYNGNNFTVKYRDNRVTDIDSLALAKILPPDKFFDRFKPLAPYFDDDRPQETEDLYREIDELSDMREHITDDKERLKIIDDLINDAKRQIAEIELYMFDDPPPYYGELPEILF